VFAVTFLGTSASVPSAERSHPSLLVEAGGHRVMVDCGEGTQRQLLRSGAGFWPFESVDDLWRRSDVPVASLVQLAEADAMNESLGLARREALWALKALRDEPLELFAAASRREARTVEEVREPSISLRPMTSGGEVVEDYRHVGLTLRQRGELPAG
jgi:DNA polymerase III alpha subunit